MFNISQTTVYRRIKLAGVSPRSLLEANKIRRFSKESIEKMRAAKRGFVFTKEHRKKLSTSKLGKKNPNFVNGRYKNPYPIQWNASLKRSIRERDNYICRLCGNLQGDRAHDVHHIDYNKNNCNPINLITLCRICNLRVNKNRDYWKKLLSELILSFYKY
jgi:hypothetical protein